MPSVGTIGNCCNSCGETGHKGIVAQKTWHGTIPFVGECDATTQATPDQTKYLRKTITVFIQSEATSISDGWTTGSPDTGAPVHCEGTSSFLHERAVTATVDKNSGVLTLSGCVENRVGPSFSGSCSVGGFSPPSAAVGFDDILCGSPSFAVVPWADVFSMLGACNGYIGTGAPQCAADLVFPGMRTPAEIIAAFEGQSSSETLSQDELCEDTSEILQSTSTSVTTVTCQCELSATAIEIHVRWSTENSTTGFVAIPGTDAGGALGHRLKVWCTMPTSSSYSMVAAVNALITLGVPYTSADVNTDAVELLNQRDLTEHSTYSWHHGCTFPLVFRDEVTTAVTPHDFEHGNCAYADPNATTGGHAGHGYTGAIINGSGVPDETVSTSGVNYDGAFMQYRGNQLLLKKYAQILVTRPGHNWFRPCGTDRDLLDGCSAARYPSAWPICGRCAVASATQNTTFVDLVLTDAAPSLLAGDAVTFTGVGILAGSYTVGTVTDSTHFQITGVVGVYVSGGYVASTGAPSYTYNTTASNGDYFVAAYAFNNRDYAVDHSIRQYNGIVYGMSQAIEFLDLHQDTLAGGGERVVSISPSGVEAWASGHAYAFDDFRALPAIDERFGSDWCMQIHQRMLNPIDRADYVEAVLAVPGGAPALPVITVGCCDVVGGLVVCAFVEVHSIAEITAFNGTGVPTKLILPPLGTCDPFDNDV